MSKFGTAGLEIDHKVHWFIQSLEMDIPLDERRAVLNKYEIKYILANTQQAEAYQKIMNQNHQLIDIVYQTEDFTLFQVNNFGDPTSENYYIWGMRFFTDILMWIDPLIKRV